MTSQKSSKAMIYLGAALGYVVFAGILFAWHHTYGRQWDSDDFFMRYMTPFSFRLRTTDFLCYALMMAGGWLFSWLDNRKHSQ